MRLAGKVAIAFFEGRTGQELTLCDNHAGFEFHPDINGLTAMLGSHGRGQLLRAVLK